MSSYEDHGSKFTPHELEFFAEDELVQIVPNFTLPQDRTLDCIGGEYGPFRPNMLAEVPLWMAMALHKRKRCIIKPPEWMSPERLDATLEEERRDSTVFQPLPFYYIEIATILLRSAKDTFDKELYQVQTLLEQVRKVRKTKIEAGLRQLQGPMTVKMNNLSCMECNMIRPFFLTSLDRYYRHAQMDRLEGTALTATQEPQTEPGPSSQPAVPRQLRRTRVV